MLNASNQCNKKERAAAANELAHIYNELSCASGSLYIPSHSTQGQCIMCRTQKNFMRRLGQRPQKNSRERPRDFEANLRDVEAVVGADDHKHMLIENTNRADIHCSFCLFRGIKKKAIYGCVKCKKGFHDNLYTAYHLQEALKGDAKALATIIMVWEKSLHRASNKRSKHVGDISSLGLTQY